MSGAATASGPREGGFSLTSGSLAMVNLQAQIDGQLRYENAQPSTAFTARAELIELVALRGHVLGRIADYEWSEELAEQLTWQAPADSAAFIACARARSRFHRFTDALADLDAADRLGAEPTVVAAERASIFQAVGRYDAALSIYNAAAERRADFESLGALATLHAERGELETAERLFDESRQLYRGVSPLPLAQLDLQRGHMWLVQHELHRALTWFDSAVRLLPAYAPAQGHLAEVEAALDNPATAIARLFPLTSSSDDPDYAATLARLLFVAGRREEASDWCSRAAVRYEELLARHPEAFADHAAEFWLEIGGDPDRALRLARINVEVRPTPRAYDLVARASRQSSQAKTQSSR